jgi:HlyD family secretion protein
MKIILSLLVILGLTIGGTMYYKKHGTVEETLVFRQAQVKRGDLLCTISATGTLEPEELVNVGAQVAGLIKEFGKDVNGKRVDYNSVVEENAELAFIDRAPYEAAVDQASAALKKSESDLLQYKAKLEQAEREWKRAQALKPQKAIAETDYDTARANLKIAEANVGVAGAAIKQNQAALRVAETNLGYTTIRSPVRGTVIDRRVNVGQTVVASLNAPSLFLIAKDLRRMQVWASVNEADIGRIRVGMPASFSVDAYPNHTFHGKVSQIRMNATMTQNVVNYTVVVSAENPDGKLLPYMTATVQFEVSNLSKVLLVPNLALRWKPKTSQMSPDEPGENGASPTNKPHSKKEPARLWVVSGEFVRPIEVTAGPTDGLHTEVSGEGVKEGMRVVVGEGSSRESEAESTGGSSEERPSNPFLPKFPKGHKPPPPPG